MNNENQLGDMMWKFVTAKLKGEISLHQGWIVNINPFTIQDQIGMLYECEGHSSLVIDHPKQLIH